MRDSFLSKKMADLKPSGIRKFFDIVATMKDVISLGIGEPDFTTPKPIIEAGVHSLTHGETHYTSNAGILEVRRAVADQLEKLYGVSYDPVAEILLTVGVSEALYLVMNAVLDPGDEVIIPTPCFVAYQAEVMLAGGVPVEIAGRMVENFELNINDLKAAITPRTKMIFIGYPSNPTGAVASRETLLQVAKIAEEHDLIVVSDEIYDRLVYGGFQHVCFAALPNMRARTVTLGGFSKAYAMTGWRIGYVCAPEKILQGLTRIHQYTIMSAPTTAQYAALEALKSGEDFVKEMVTEYDRRRRLIVDGFNHIGLPTFEPRGAFYDFPRVSVTGLDDETFANRRTGDAIQNVLLLPGGRQHPRRAQLGRVPGLRRDAGCPAGGQPAGR